MEISLQTSIYQDQSGAWRGRLDVDFPDVTLTVDQKPVTVTGYELYGYETALYEGDAEPVWEQYGGSDTSSITRMDLPPGTEYVMKVRAVGGVWSSEFSVFIGHDTIPPPQPTKPTAEVFLGAITVKWDKKAVTGDMPADFEGAILCVGTEPSPGLEQAVTRFDMHEAIFVITGAAYYTPVYIRLIAVDTTGNFSPWSEQEVAFTKPLVDADIILGEIDAGETRIINAGKILLETGKELSEKLQEADTAIDSTRKALEGPGGLTERLRDAEGLLRNVGDATMADGTALKEKLADNAAAIDATRESLTGPGGLTERISGAETKLRDVGALTMADGTTLSKKLADNAAAISTASAALLTLRETTLPKLNLDLSAASERLDAADILLKDTFPKRLTAIEGTASNAATRATAAETAAAKAAADLATAKQRADAAAADAAQAARDADAAEAASERATGAAGEAEAAADKAAKDALAALAAAQNAGGDVGAAQRAAAAAQTAADAAKAQATSAGTAAAAADAKAAQAAADAAKAAADALLAQQQATKSAGEATVAKGEAAAAATKAAAAEAAAATAKTRADTAAADATAAAAKATAAEASATKATGSAGVAETAADKAAKDAAAALTQAQTSGSNATAAQRAADAAKTASDTAAAQAATAGTAAAKADAAAAKAAADAAQAAADLIVARNAAADARGDADTALARADDAVRAAGSAARVLYSTGDPSGTAREGDTWRKTNGAAGDVIAEWRYTKVGTAAASWKPQKVTSDMVSNLDIGKLTAGTANIVTLVAERIAGATAEFQRVDAKNIFVTGTASFNEVVAKRIAADTGQYLTLGVEQLTVSGAANMQDVVADRIFTNLFSTRKLTASQVLIGPGANMIGDPRFTNAQALMKLGNSGVGWDTYKSSGGSVAIRYRKTGVEGFFYPLGFNNAGSADKTEWLDCAPGDEYVYTANIYNTGGQYRVYANVMLDDETVVGVQSDRGWVTTSAGGDFHFKLPAKAAKFGLTIQIQQTAADAWFAIYGQNHTLIQKLDNRMIVDGGILAKHITASEEMGAKIGKFITLGVEQLTVTGAAKLKDAVAERLFANIFTANKISTQHMLIGNFSNLLENGSFEYGQQGWGDGATKSYWTFEPTGGKQNPGVLKFTGTTTRAFGPNSSIPIPVDPLDTYRLNGWMRTTSAGPVQGEICWYWYRADGSFLSNNNLFFREMKAADGWVPVTGQKAPPAEAAFLKVRVVGTLAKETDELYFDDIGVSLATDASLLVDGSVTAKTITASEEMGAKLAKFIKLEVTDLVSTGSAKINEAVITKLFTETFATNKLTAGQVLIGMPGNVLPDIGHNEPLMVAARNASSTMTVTLSSSNDLALAHTSGTSYFRPYGVPQDTVSYKNWIPVKPGQVWRWGLKVISLKGGGSIKFVGRTLDGQAYANPAAQTTLATGTGSYTVEAEIPEGCAWIIPEMSLLTATGSSWVARGSMFMHQVIDNALVVDGAITTKKLTVTADMTAALLKAKKVEAIEIDVNSLKADTAWIGALRTGILVTDVVTSTHIKSDSITADLLKADAITAKHTLTGALVRSAASGARTEMTNQGLRVLDASNVELLRLGYGIGTGMSIRNPTNGTLTPLSNMVFGAQYFASTIPIDYAPEGTGQTYAPSMIKYGWRWLMRTASAQYEYTAVSESALFFWEATVNIWNTNTRYSYLDFEYVPFELGMNIFNITGNGGTPGELVDMGNHGRYVTGWVRTGVGAPSQGDFDGPIQGMGMATGLTPGEKYKVPLYLKAPATQANQAYIGALNVRVKNIRITIIPR